MSIWPDGILAPLLAVALFVTWGAIGDAILRVCDTGLDGGRRLLAAPAVGAAVCVFAILWINWSGVPIRRFAWPLFGVLATLAAAAMWLRASRVEPRDLWPAALPLAAALLLNGWPLVTHGFGWLSYTNDDMATYCLMANRLLDYGLVEPPSASVLAAGADLSANMWLFEVAFGRPGPHLMLAWTAALTGQSVLEVYMPVLIATQLALVAAAGAMVWREQSQRRAGLAACWLMAASAMTTLGVVSQLLPQTLGLGLACAFLAIVWDLDRPPFGIGRTAIAALVGAMLVLVYTEVVPFVAIPWLGRMCALRLWRRDRQRLRFMVEAIVALGVLCAAPYADRVITFLVAQSSEGLQSVVRVERFPYMRLSTVFANLWGWLPLARGGPEPVLSIAIVMSALVFVTLAVALVRPLRRGDTAPAVLLFMLIFGVLLFAGGSGFGVFKIAMYAQPFMFGTVALLLAGPSAAVRVRSQWIAIALVAILDLPTQAYYVRSSVDATFARTQFVDQPAAMRELLALRSARRDSVDVDLPIAPMAKLAAAFLHDVPLRFLGLREFFRPRGNTTFVAARFRRDVAALNAVVRQDSAARVFALHDPQRPSMTNRFALVERRTRDSSAPSPCDAVLTAAPIQSVVNRSSPSAAATEGDALRLVPCGTLTNHLAFVSSELGRNYYYADADPVGLFALEADYFFPGRTFAGIGRHLLFEVLQPQPASRLVFDFTASLKADGANRLPPVAVIGNERVAFGPGGRGSARLYSPPVSPQWIDGHAYVALDLGVDGTLYPDRRRGLMLWLGRDLLLDPRRMVGLARNISLISEDEYARLEPPEKLERFPRDLDAPSVEYSGIYEDGWVAEDLFVKLKRPGGPAKLTVKGMLLPTGSGSGMTITVDVDGAAVATERRNPGPFTIEVPLAATAATRLGVRVRFSEVRPLSAEDRRPSSAHLEYLGVAPGR